MASQFALPLEDYGLIGDCTSAALVGRNGSLDWLCWPRFDSAACFCALLGSPEHGRWSLRPRDDGATTSGSNSIDALFAKPAEAPAMAAITPAASDGVSLGLPKLSTTSLANADSWFWLAFASVIFFIVTTVAALYMQTVENNARNFHIAGDYRHRQKQFTQLHLLELADRRQ